MEKKTGLCLSCNAAFAEAGKLLVENVMENVNLIARSDDPKAIVARCEAVEESVNKLIALQEEYSLETSSELLDLLSRHKEIKQKALSAMKK